MYDGLDQAIEESLGRKLPDNNKVLFYFHYCVPSDADGLNLNVQGSWRVYLLIMTPGARNQEVRRPMRDEDKHKFPDAWARFELSRARELEHKRASLEFQLAALAELTAESPPIAVIPTAKRRGRPPKASVQ